MHFALRSSGRRGRRRGRVLQIVDTVFLPGAASLHVVAIANRHLIIGRGAAQITLLGELPESEAVSLHRSRLSPCASSSATTRRLPARCSMRSIERLGHEVVAEANDLGELLERCADVRPDIAIVDGRLPPEGGLVAVERLHRIQSELPIIFIASVDEVALLRSALAAGALGGLGRPFLRSQVEQTLQRFARTG